MWHFLIRVLLCGTVHCGCQVELESKVEDGAGDVAMAVGEEAGDAANEAEDTDEEAGDAAEAVDEATRDIVVDQADTSAKVLVRTLALSKLCSYNFWAAWHGLVFESSQSEFRDS